MARRTILKKGYRFLPTEEAPAARVFRRKWGFGAQIHIQNYRMYITVVVVYPIGIEGDKYIIHMHPCASVCSHMHPSRVRIHPYTPICLHYAPEWQCSTRLFATKYTVTQMCKPLKSKSVLHPKSASIPSQYSKSAQQL